MTSGDYTNGYWMNGTWYPYLPYQYPQYPTVFNYPAPAPSGWQCPGCKVHYAPSITSCLCATEETEDAE
jgi:hypothetical protein